MVTVGENVRNEKKSGPGRGFPLDALVVLPRTP
jgi:hypothetical protein